MAEKDKSADVLSKILAYVDSPFKLFAIIVMGVLAFGGYFIWQNQELLVGAYKERFQAINNVIVQYAITLREQVNLSMMHFLNIEQILNILFLKLFRPPGLQIHQLWREIFL